MDISCAFPTTLDSPAHIKLAEDLGYRRAWLYDTPQQSPDVWMTLAVAAQLTERIGLGPGVLVPSLRHPMVNAAATAALAGMAPGRVAVGFGTGFTGRRAMGYRPLSWSFTRRYILAYQGLLHGDTVEWEGARMRMLHPSRSAPARPVHVPILISAHGPKGRKVAQELGHGLFTVRNVDPEAKRFPWVACVWVGSVRDEGEAPGSERERAAAGPGWAAFTYHAAYEVAGRRTVQKIPGGEEWLAVIERHPEPDRHLAVHLGHCIEMNEADDAAWEVAGPALVEQITMTATASNVQQRLAALADQGVTEIVYQPAGPDLERELQKFITAATA